MNYVFDARVIQDHFPGIGRYAYNLLLHLPDELRDGERITALHDGSARSTYLNARNIQDERVTFVDYRVPIFSPRNLMPPSGTARRGVDLYHFTYYVRPYQLRKPAVTTIYDAISHVYPQLAPSAKARIIIHLLTSLAVRRSEAILTISNSAAQDIAHYYPASRGKITVTPLAAGEQFRPADAQARSDVASRCHLPEHFVLSLASNKPHKNLVRLVEAWSLVQRDLRLDAQRGDSAPSNLQSLISNPDLPLLVIAGHQDPRYGEAQARAMELGIAGGIKFIGATRDEDLPALYSACDLFVFPSLYEGFGLPPLEAMACGAPVACSNTSSIPEVAGDAAILFDPLQPQEIAQAMGRVLKDLTLQADLRARSLRQAARFTWNQCARTTLEVYRSVVQMRT